ncbi:unnamed protein product [Sphenostylis stenocarpa]|uniref:Uncharacterized protein n=1 Tax=Sphenostylis stenocarpa TaxID=92480 RepID=A0AA86SEU1_9FABA|nr:unnamed protein product [Sphenostylis stenocarpa]
MEETSVEDANLRDSAFRKRRVVTCRHGEIALTEILVSDLPHSPFGIRFHLSTAVIEFAQFHGLAQIPSMTIGSVILLQPHSHRIEQEYFVARSNINQEYYQGNLTTMTTKFGSHTTNSHFTFPSLV